MAASSRSATMAELRRMFSNLDATVIESVLVANNGQVDVAIDQLLTMSIDTENHNNIQQATPHTPLRQLPAVPNIYDDDPPPYPGHETNVSIYPTVTPSLSQRSGSVLSHQLNPTPSLDSNVNSQQDLQVRRWKTADGHYRICYIGDLPDDFLRVRLLAKSEMNHPSMHHLISGETTSGSRYTEQEQLAALFEDEEFLNELRRNKEFLSTLHSDQIVRSPSTPAPPPHRPTNLLSTKPLPLPTPPTIETPKTPKIRARMLQNALTQIEQGQSMKTSMVPEESITQNEEYSYGKDTKERVPLPPAPFVSDFDPARSESNEEFIARLKHMGKNSMEKFNQLARRFSTRKDSAGTVGKYSKQTTVSNTAERQRLANDFDSDDDRLSMNSNNPNRYLASV